MQANIRNGGKGGQELSGPSALLITCPRGLASLLHGEIRALGLGPAGERAAGVGCQGSLDDALRLNLHLRTAHRVLFRLADFRVDSTDALHERLKAIPWEEYFAPDGRFFVGGVARHPSLRDPRFALLRAKDAVADRIREACGRRPDSGPEEEGAAGLFLHWGADGRAQVYLDTTGRPLAFRGYRRARTDAPLQETLAAALLMTTGWKPDRPLVLPMCGSGTLAIEAAWMARRRAPALDRADFAFMHLRGFDAARWSALVAEARAAIRPLPGPRILATDHNPGAIAAARANAAAAGVADDIEFRVCEFAQTPVPDGATVLMNPPYGVRTGADAGLPELYRRIGDFIRFGPADTRGFVFTSDESLARATGLEPFLRREFWNGPLACALWGFEATPSRRGRGRG